ncbi:MAG: hypothetical protein CVV64_08780 [Candidatus Wallbacteria bacterium HGW-Wallbacteria-1]|jgi:hypothetical protein|uniref:Uncharacterized protein n=1 Tax=Candidatus Wallbacteria bacterium HGW-Wallbacteria-1 TaxID=2013854 RepID=A0A2N1PQ39_9BACT|nr:MAG: hypothetical protein CVV64_08780 [Candidatus Wallbacteria bacterium HGW-Wallbacteria-1]
MIMFNNRGTGLKGSLSIIMVLAGLMLFFLSMAEPSLAQYSDPDEIADEIQSESELEDYLDYENYEEIVDAWERRQSDEADDYERWKKDKRGSKMGDLTLRTYKTANDSKDPYYYVRLRTEYNDRLNTYLNVYKKTGDAEWFLTKGYVDIVTYYGDRIAERIRDRSGAGTGDGLQRALETGERVVDTLGGELGLKTAGAAPDGSPVSGSEVEWSDAMDRALSSEAILKPEKDYASPKTDTNWFFRFGRFKTNEMSDKYMAKQGGKKLSMTGYKLAIPNKRVVQVGDKTETTSMSGVLDGLVVGKHWSNVFWYSAYGVPMWMDNMRFFWTSFDFVIDMNNYMGYTWRNLSDSDTDNSLSWVSVYGQRKLGEGKLYAEFSKFEDAADLWYNKYTTGIRKLSLSAKHYRKRRIAADVSKYLLDFSGFDRISTSLSATYKLTPRTSVLFKVDQSDTKTLDPGSEYQYTTSELRYKATDRANLKFYYKWGRSTKDSTQFKGQLDYAFSKSTSVSSYIKFYNSDISLTDKKKTYFYLKVKRKLRWADRMTFSYYNTTATGSEAVHQLKGEYVLAF